LVKSVKEAEDEKDQYLGLSLRELIHEFKHQTLVLLKCALLQPKVWIEIVDGVVLSCFECSQALDVILRIEV
jgi:hypothetical protein